MIHRKLTKRTRRGAVNGEIVSNTFPDDLRVLRPEYQAVIIGYDVEIHGPRATGSRHLGYARVVAGVGDSHVLNQQGGPEWKRVGWVDYNGG